MPVQSSPPLSWTPTNDDEEDAPQEARGTPPFTPATEEDDGLLGTYQECDAG